MPDLSDDERMLLKALAAAKEPIGVVDLVCRDLPLRTEPPSHEWVARFLEMMMVWSSLFRAGLLNLVLPDHCEITVAGREALAEAEGQRDG